MSKVIAVTNEKGGCGKTTTALTLASIIGQEGYKVLLVDMDYQSYASSHLDAYDESRPGIFEVMQGFPVSEAIHKTEFRNLSILPATIAFKAGEEMLIMQKLTGVDHLHVLSNSLAPIRNDYDYIFIDCPPNGVYMKENIQAFADYLILPMIPDDTALHALLCVANEMVDVKQRINPQLEVLGVLVVLYENTRNKNAYTQAIMEQTIFPAFKRTVRKNTTISEAINAKRPVNYYSRSCNSSIDYRLVAQEILKQLEGENHGK